jgi:acetylornithine deacetylase/succinyl-diaminopimelate desuccinylase-like protein
MVYFRGVIHQKGKMQKKISKILLGQIFIFVCITNLAWSQVPTLSPDQERARGIFKELIEINTTHSTGNTTMAAHALAKRLVDAGFDQKDVVVIGPAARNQNLVVRFRGSGKKPPILFLGHLDVVEARREDWSMDPFILTETGGYFYGRGSLDMKESDAILVSNFIRMKTEGFLPDRDLILALTAGEESGGEYDGVEWLVKNQHALIDADFCINLDAGEPQRKGGKRVLRPVQISEKGIFYMTLEVRNPGGHSSQPSKNNAIYRLADGLVHMETYDFPVELTGVTKSYFSTMSAVESGQLAEDMKAVAGNIPDTSAVNRLAKLPYYNALMRTTCVATVLEAGNSINALPQLAKATVNCRLLPGATQEEVVKTITGVLSDSQIAVSVIIPLIVSPPSDPKGEIMQTVQQVSNKLWPGLPVLPIMGVGASDGKYLRAAGMPTYGISGVFLDVDDFRMHGKDERIRVDDFYDGLQYNYELIRAFSTHP